MDEVCRTCVRSKNPLRSIFVADNDLIELHVKLYTCFPTINFDDSDFPTKMCNICIKKLQNAYKFRELCIKSTCMLLGKRENTNKRKKGVVKINTKNNNKNEQNTEKEKPNLVFYKSTNISFIDEDEPHFSALSTNTSKKELTTKNILPENENNITSESMSVETSETNIADSTYNTVEENIEKEFIESNETHDREENFENEEKSFLQTESKSSSLEKQQFSTGIIKEDSKEEKEIINSKSNEKEEISISTPSTNKTRNNKIKEEKTDKISEKLFILNDLDNLHTILKHTKEKQKLVESLKKSDNTEENDLVDDSDKSNNIKSSLLKENNLKDSEIINESNQIIKPTSISELNNKSTNILNTSKHTEFENEINLKINSSESSISGSKNNGDNLSKNDVLNTEEMDVEEEIKYEDEIDLKTNLSEPSVCDSKINKDNLNEKEVLNITETNVEKETEFVDEIHLKSNLSEPLISDSKSNKESVLNSAQTNVENEIHLKTNLSEHLNFESKNISSNNDVLSSAETNIEKEVCSEKEKSKLDEDKTKCLKDNKNDATEVKSKNKIKIKSLMLKYIIKNKNLKQIDCTKKTDHIEEQIPISNLKIKTKKYLNKRSLLKNSKIDVTEEKSNSDNKIDSPISESISKLKRTKTYSNKKCLKDNKINVTGEQDSYENKNDSSILNVIKNNNLNEIESIKENDHIKEQIPISYIKITKKYSNKKCSKNDVTGEESSSENKNDLKSSAKDNYLKEIKSIKENIEQQIPISYLNVTDNEKYSNTKCLKDSKNCTSEESSSENKNNSLLKSSINNNLKEIECFKENDHIEQLIENSLICESKSTTTDNIHDLEDPEKTKETVVADRELDTNFSTPLVEQQIKHTFKLKVKSIKSLNEQYIKDNEQTSKDLKNDLTMKNTTNNLITPVPIARLINGSNIENNKLQKMIDELDDLVNKNITEIYDFSDHNDHNYAKIPTQKKSIEQIEETKKPYKLITDKTAILLQNSYPIKDYSTISKTKKLKKRINEMDAKNVDEEELPIKKSKFEFIKKMEKIKEPPAGFTSMKLSEVKNDMDLAYPYGCDLCNMRSKTLDELEMHLAMHINKQNKEKKFSCKYCERSFHSIAGFKMHNMRIHKTVTNVPSEILSYTCEVCSKVFPSKSSWCFHRKIHHLNPRSRSFSINS